MFSPLEFPKGSVIYELVTYMPPPSHLSLSPFDLYREPLAVIALSDGKELGEETFSSRRSLNGAAVTVTERNVRALDQELEALRDDYGRALVHQVLLFDYEDPPGHKIPMPEGIIPIPPADKCKKTTMKSVMCKLSSLLLAEMTMRAKSIEAIPMIDSPGQMSTSRQINGTSWGLDDANGLSRRNSQHGPLVNARSSSASELVDRSHARMSMPPVPFKASPMASSTSTPARPSTPVKSNLSNPPMTFDAMGGGQESGPSTPEQNFSRPDTSEGFRQQSQDRVSVQGFGPGSANERSRNKGKARVMIVIGSMYLQAGRWSDALRELGEGAAVARSVNDHVWHGKALELIVLALLLLAWSDLEFTVPMVCYPPPEKGAPDLVPKDAGPNPDQPKQLRNLQAVLPELLERIVGLYSRISSENLPPLPLSEAIIRFCRILSALHLCDGILRKEALEMIVLGKPPSKVIGTSPRLTVIPSRQDITKLLFRAFPSSGPELIATVDRATILSGIAAVLGLLGHHRKKAMVIRELIAVLIGGLVEARTRGAADVGIHPAAGLVALQTAGGHPSNTGSVALELQEQDIEQGVDAFLGTLVKTFGIVSFDPANPLSLPEKNDDSDDAVVARIQRQSVARFFSIPDLKISMLRACINFSEALPDFNGVLKYSSDMLRTVGRGVAPGPRKEDASANLDRDEQIRLLTNISKTHALSRRLGFDHLYAEYWDEFLIRGIVLDPLPSNKMPIPHPKSDLPGAATVRTSQDVDPFIYNPFLKQPDKAAVEQTLVVGEATTFKVTLQNPLDVEVDVEKITLDAEGAEFESMPATTLIGPYRTQMLQVSGIPKACGPLRLTGAIVQVRGCRARRFPIFTDPWMPENDVKPKAVGIAALEKSLVLPSSILPPPKPSHLGLKVIPEQPLVAIKSSTLPQSCVMILEGERQTFSVTLENLSKTTPVDFMLFSFEDSTQDPLQAALKNKDSTPSEIYEYELILMKKQALKLRKNQGKRFIAPGGTSTFDFEVFGKPGLTNASIQMDYAHLGLPPEEVEDQFYTRRVSVHLTVTVNASVELSRYDILPVLDKIPRPLWTRVSNQESELALTKDEYCLLSLDLINAWPSTMLIRFEGADGVEVEDYILPGNTSRIILPIRRIFLDDPHAAVPSLNPSNRRQFVVSASHISPDFERSLREAFWYKENILDNLKATWKTLSGPTRTGTIDLRGIRLTSRMIDAIKVDDIGISVSVEDPSSPEEASDSPCNVFVDEFVQVKVNICNRTSRPIYPLLRLMPALCHRPPNVALDYARKFAWNGTLQQVLPLLEGKSSTHVVLGATALCRGQFEITASVEETMLWEEPGADEGEKKEGKRERSDTQSLMDKALGKKERRIWHAREGCIVHVRDRES